MKTRNIIFATLLTTFVGSAVAFAGSSGCDRGSHGFGSHHRGFTMDRMIGKLGRHLDLSDQQLGSLEEIMTANQKSMHSGKQAGLSLRRDTMMLDPSSETFDTEVNAMADRLASLARDQALVYARVYKQVAAVLTDDQRSEMQSLMQRRMQHDS